jgi:hypothetical protein
MITSSVDPAALDLARATSAPGKIRVELLSATHVITPPTNATWPIGQIRQHHKLSHKGGRFVVYNAGDIELHDIPSLSESDGLLGSQ